MRTCDRHQWRVTSCPDCAALNASVALRAIEEDLRTARAGMLTPDEEERLRPVKDRVTLDDRVRAYDDEGTVIPLVNWEELIDTIERSVRGEVGE
jgi:hypothetical protein